MDLIFLIENINLQGKENVPRFQPKSKEINLKHMLERYQSED